MMQAQIRSAASLSAKSELLADVQAACEAVLETIAEYDELISRKEPDTAKLTSIRLQLAQNRLAHGSIVERVAEYLREHNPSAELTIRNLQPEHAGLLHRTSAHTQRWTLVAVESDWPQYCSETREMLRCWTQRVRVEGGVLRRLLEEN
jgi:hypothetical protein